MDPPELTALLGRVALFQIFAGPGRVLLASIWALHALDLAAESLQRSLYPGVYRHDGGPVADGHGLVLAELGRRWGAGV